MPDNTNPAEHLKDHRFQKGRSGNPGGRPKGRSITAALRRLAETDHNGKPIAEVLAEVMMKQALSGHYNFAREIVERLDGKVPDKAEVETKGEQRVYVCPPPRIIGEVQKKLPEDE